MRQSHLLASTILSAVTICFATSVSAQTAVQPVQDPDDEVATEVDEVVVTGSRLRLPEYTQPNPVVTLTEENLEDSGITNLTDYLQDVPSLVGSIDLEAGADTSTPSLVGVNLLDLRNLGSVRTLTLVNGRRHVAANPGTTAVDTNSIPLALVERIEILTGGASAVYGADGVSGVVNFILKDDFEGVDFRTQYGWADAGVGSDTLVSALVGQNFLGDRANLTFAAEYQQSEDVKFDDRDFTRTGKRFTLFTNPAERAVPGDDPNIFDQVLLNDVRYIDSSLAGSVYTNLFTSPTTSGVSFLGNGSPFIDGAYLGGAFMQGGSGTLTDKFNDDLLPGFERLSLNSTFKFEMSPAAEFFGELKYNKTNSDFRAQPSYDYGLFIHDENPFIPANVLADARTPGGFATPGGREAYCDFGIVCAPDNGVLLARDNFDFGTQSYEVERETWRGVFGVRGDLTDYLSYELSAVYGRTTQEVYAYNVRLNDRYFAATDVIRVNGQNVCRSNITPGAAPVGDLYAADPFKAAFHGTTFTPGPNSGCLAVSPFGEAQNSAEAIAWFMTDATQVSTIEQTVVNGFVSGTTEPWFSLPAGPVSFVLGAEYRKEQSDFVPSDIEALGESIEYTLSTLGRGVRTVGEFDVAEAFTEVSVPLLVDLPWAKELTLNAAYRFSDYSSSGKTDTWNVSGQWRLNDTIMLRGTKARAVRAPNINNLFAGNVQTFAALSDPCDFNNQAFGENPTVRQKNCAADLTALGINPLTFENTSSESIGGFIRGNPDLQPEEADTVTLGLVITPAFIPGFLLSLDYYDVQIDDAITSYAAQTIVNNCYDVERPNPFCDLVERGTSGGNAGRITEFSQVPGNIGSFETAGYDLTVRYAFDPANFGIDQNIGRLDLSLIANLLDKLVFVEAEDATPTDALGGLGAPEYQLSFDATWRWNALSVNYGWNWFAETRRYSQATLIGNRDVAEERFKYYPARSSHEFQVRYDVSDQISVYGGVNNFTNQLPEPSAYDYPISAMGRFFYVGLNAKLGSLGDVLRW